MTRRLIAATGAGSFVTDPVALIESVLDITAADDYLYHATDDRGKVMGFFRVVDDGAGGYVAQYSWSNITNDWEVDVATGPSPIGPWTYQATIELQAHSGTIARRADGSFVIAFEKDLQTYLTGGNYVVVRTYDNLADLLAGSHSATFNIPRTLAAANHAEGTPTFYDAEEPMDISFHYNLGGGDFEARGTLTGMSSWVAAAETAFNAALTAAGEFTRGRAAIESLLGREIVIVEAATSLIDFSTWRLFHYAGGPATEVTVTSHGGSTSQAVPSLSIVDDPTGPGRVLCASCWFFPTGAAPGEAGLAIWYRSLP